jgi:hypothetical protein
LRAATLTPEQLALVNGWVRDCEVAWLESSQLAKVRPGAAEGPEQWRRPMGEDRRKPKAAGVGCQESI